MNQRLDPTTKKWVEMRKPTPIRLPSAQTSFALTMQEEGLQNAGSVRKSSKKTC